MPKEYLECKKAYMEKGVSERTASARCAAMYFKRHGITVNEAHEKGLASFPDLEGMTEDDFRLATLIISGLDEIESRTSATKPDTHGEELGIVASNVDFLDEFGTLEIVATKVGASAYTADGRAVVWTERALKKAAPTWVLGAVSINHNGKNYGRIIASYFHDGALKMLVKVNDKLKGWLKNFGKKVGVSIEATMVKLNKKLEVVDAKGTGVTFVFPPETPACDVSEGCGIVGTETFVPPPAGDLPEGGRKILETVYNKCRETMFKEDTPENKTRCAKIARSAVRKAGYVEDENGKWHKTEGSVPDEDFLLSLNTSELDSLVEGEEPSVEAEDETENLVDGIVSSKPISPFDSEKEVSSPANINEDRGTREGFIMEDKNSHINLSEFVFAKVFDQLSEQEKTNLLSEIDGARLTYQERKDLPDSAFCGPDRTFPAHDAAHVRNGLARLPQAKGLSESQRAAIHACLASRAKKYGIEVSSTVSEKKTGETMVDETETICAKKHEAIVKAKDSEIEAKVKEIESLKAVVAKYEAEKKARVLETFAKETGLDPKQYESKDISVLEDIMATIKLLKEKENKEPEKDSGAVVKATEQQTKPEGDVVTATLNEAEEKAKKEAEELARINAAASKIDGKKR